MSAHMTKMTLMYSGTLQHECLLQCGYCGIWDGTWWVVGFLLLELHTIGMSNTCVMACSLAHLDHVSIKLLCVTLAYSHTLSDVL